LARDEALRVINQVHLFAITSLKDLTSTVLLEALSQGVPVIALDHCGFSNVLNETCGIKLPVGKPRQIIEGFAEAIAGVWRDEAARQSMAAGALTRVKDFSWERKSATLEAIYQKVTAVRQNPQLQAMPVPASQPTTM
jgi:glycosyltransferase involved in cell wall biosynthesis